jgi:hypothetical protein
MATTLQDILLDSAAFIDLEATLPTGEELASRVRYANMAVREAANLSLLPELSMEYVVDISTLASISLPANLKELEEAPALLRSDGYWDKYEQINPRLKHEKGDTDKYSYILGNPADGKTLILNNPTANATLSIQYQRNASGMATLTDTCELEDCDYVVTKLNAYVLKARGDDKFQVIDAEANAKLKNMIGRSQKQPSGGSGSTPKTSNFVIGE